MNDDTHDDAVDAPTDVGPNDYHESVYERDDAFSPYHVPDRHTRRVRDDHAPNQALHDAFAAAFETADDSDRVTVNLMASHAPGEKPGEPTYEVWVESRNEGVGHPLPPKPVRRMVDRDDAVITGIVECSDDHLIVSLRPVEVRVDPVEVEYRDIPDRFVDLDDVEHDAAVVLRKCVDEYGVDSDRAGEAARSLATVLYTANPDRYTEFVDDPDAAPRAAYRQLWRRAGVDPDTDEVTNLRPEGSGGYVWEGSEDERVADLDFDPDFDPETARLPLVGGTGDVDDAIDAARNLLHSDPYAGFPYTEVGGDFPMTRPPVEPIREWVEDHRHTFLADKGDAREVAETIADAIENFVVTGKVDPDRVDTFDDGGATQDDVEDAVDDVDGGATDE